MKLFRSVTFAIQSENMCVLIETDYDKDKEADEQIIEEDEINDENYNEGDLRNKYNKENKEDDKDDKDDNMDENGNEEYDDEMVEEYEDMDNNANENDNENEKESNLFRQIKF